MGIERTRERENKTIRPVGALFWELMTTGERARTSMIAPGTCTLFFWVRTGHLYVLSVCDVSFFSWDCCIGARTVCCLCHL
jgi:hypothetical protein